VINDNSAKEYKTIIERSLIKVQGYDRRDFLFLFAELKDAFIFSSKIYKGNANIYTVLVDSHDIIYRGDMNVLDTLTLAINLGICDNDISTFEALCLHYWKNGKTFSPCYEYIVKKAQIVNQLCNVEDCMAFYKSFIDYGIVEACTIYRKKLFESFQ
jgi:putative toxin-antitoxin system protein